MRGARRRRAACRRGFARPAWREGRPGRRENLRRSRSCSTGQVGTASGPCSEQLPRAWSQKGAYCREAWRDLNSVRLFLRIILSSGNLNVKATNFDKWLKSCYLKNKNSAFYIFSVFMSVY